MKDAVDRLKKKAQNEQTVIAQSALLRANKQTIESLQARIAELESELHSEKHNADGNADEVHCLKVQQEENYVNAKGIAAYMALNYFPDVTDWAALNDTAGVLSQISNMVTGLQRKEQTTVKQEPVAWFEKTSYDVWFLAYSYNPNPLAEAKPLFAYPPDAAARIAELEAEASAYKRLYHDEIEVRDAFAKENIELEAQLAEYKADAERLQTQRDELLSVSSELLCLFESEIHNEYDGTRMLNDRLSEADFARAAIAKVEEGK